MTTMHAPVYQFLADNGELIAAKIEDANYTGWCRVGWLQFHRALLPTFPYDTEPGIEPWAGRWRVVNPPEVAPVNPAIELYKAVDGAARELFAESAPAYPGHADREARAWTLRAFLLELVAPPVPERYPLCPTCGGCGYVEGAEVFAASWDYAAEYDPEDCPSCGGIGELAPPYGWPVDGARCRACGEELVSPQRDLQMAGWCEGCQNWGDQA